MDAHTLWEQVHGCFNEDDGSLPGILLEPLNADEVAAIYDSVMQTGTIVSQKPEYYDTATNRMVPLRQVPNAARLVAQDAASPFHVVFGGIQVEGQELPELGLFVFQNSIEVDYRMGPDWTPAKVFALFTLLKQLVRLTESGRVLPSDQEGPPYPEKFAAA